MPGPLAGEHRKADDDLEAKRREDRRRRLLARMAGRECDPLRTRMLQARRDQRTVEPAATEARQRHGAEQIRRPRERDIAPDRRNLAADRREQAVPAIGHCQREFVRSGKRHRIDAPALGHHSRVRSDRGAPDLDDPGDAFVDRHRSHRGARHPTGHTRLEPPRGESRGEVGGRTVGTHAPSEAQPERPVLGDRRIDDAIRFMLVQDGTRDLVEAAVRNDEAGTVSLC